MSNQNMGFQLKRAAIFIAVAILSSGSYASPGQHFYRGQLVHFVDPFTCDSEQALLQAIALHNANQGSQISEIKNEDGYPACMRPPYPDANYQVITESHGNAVNVRLGSRIFDDVGLWTVDSSLALGESPNRKSTEAEFGSTLIFIDGRYQVERDEIRRRVSKVPTKRPKAIANYLDGYYNALSALIREGKSGSAVVEVNYSEETPGAGALKAGSQSKQLQSSDIVVTLGTGTDLFMVKKEGAVDPFATFPDANECEIRPHDNITYVVRASESGQTYIPLDRLANWLIRGICDSP